ncbi:MAG TPA: glutamate-1-semialdehyde 2,1-aminomutase [Candidatus Tumulicola sp.]|nr:glutamate-1-semialdehyde 2,1-aminomutase [Candidatus Tumulicola sp.]
MSVIRESPQSGAERQMVRALEVLAGGVNSPVRAGTPMGGPSPLIASARGSKLRDTAGREYIDYLCAYGAALLGHAAERIARAVTGALARGAVFGVTHAEEIRLAQRIRERFPSMERVRLVTTGTEACMSAIRTARAFTRRERFIRFAGNYHGHSDEMIFSAGASSRSAPSLECGVPASAIANALVLPYNDADAVAAAIRECGSEIAAIVLEPIVANMGLVLPAPGYLERLRELCDRNGSVLIFDEVITGFRVDAGGAQARVRVRPDLTCIGKTLGGGLPIAAFGGRADIMGVLAPGGGVFVGGTHAGNPVSVAAAHAFLDELEADPGMHERLNGLARRLAEGARAALKEAALDYPVVQVASIVDFMFRTGPPHRDYAKAREADERAYAAYYWRMMERGVFLAPSQMEVMFLTAAHTEEDIDRTIAALRGSLLD